MPDWFDNDELFREQLSIGFTYTDLVAQALRDADVACEVPEKHVREAFDGTARNGDEDIVVGQHVIEVKSRTCRFSGPGDFPFDPIMVDNVGSWDRKDRQPVAVVCISQVSGGMIVLPVRTTRDRWKRQQFFDHVRRIEAWKYVAARSLWLPFDDLVAFLRKQRPGPIAGMPEQV